MLYELQTELNEKVDFNNLHDPEIIKLSEELAPYIVADMKGRTANESIN